MSRSTRADDTMSHWRNLANRLSTTGWSSDGICAVYKDLWSQA